MKISTDLDMSSSYFRCYSDGVGESEMDDKLARQINEERRRKHELVDQIIDFIKNDPRSPAIFKEVCERVVTKWKDLEE